MPLTKSACWTGLTCKPSVDSYSIAATKRGNDLRRTKSRHRPLASLSISNWSPLSLRPPSLSYHAFFRLVLLEAETFYPGYLVRNASALFLCAYRFHHALSSDQSLSEDRDRDSIKCSCLPLYYPLFSDILQFLCAELATMSLLHNEEYVNHYGVVVSFFYPSYGNHVPRMFWLTLR